MHRHSSILRNLFSRLLQRLNPLCKPVIPAHFTIFTVAVTFTLLHLFNPIFNTFASPYGELAVSAWGFVFLLAFIESLAEIFRHDEDH